MSNPSQVHHRRSIRLPGYDYSQPGAYFVTLVAEDRLNRFGEISDGEVRLNLAGQCAVSLWQGLPRHFAIALDEWVVMPNHLHGIIVIGADFGKGEASGMHEPATRPGNPPDASPLRSHNRPQGTIPGSLGAIVQNYKSTSTRRINGLQGTPGAPVWQRNYYERIIRNEIEWRRIREYILNNPSQWELDQENPNRTS